MFRERQGFVRRNIKRKDLGKTRGIYTSYVQLHTMKIYYCDISNFEQLLIDNSIFENADSKGYLDPKKISGNAIKVIKEISTALEVSPSDIIYRTVSFLSDEKLYSTNLEINVKFESSNHRIHIYCPQFHLKALNPTKSYASYGIQDGSILFYEHEWISQTSSIPDGTAASVEIGKYSKDIREFITSELDLDGQYSRLKFILFYTDEDVKLAKYIRQNYAALVKMSESYVDLLILEQPYKLDNIHPYKYWKSLFESKLFEALKFIGYTSTKPYDKYSLYKLAEDYDIKFYDFPCILISSRFAKTEHFSIKVSPNPKLFFRKLMELSKIRISNRREFLSLKMTYIKQDFMITRNKNIETNKEIFDVFICHASEDKEQYVIPLVENLQNHNINCWIDKSEIEWGDSLVRKINEGLKFSKFVIVVLSSLLSRQ